MHAAARRPDLYGHAGRRRGQPQATRLGQERRRDRGRNRKARRAVEHVQERMIDKHFKRLNCFVFRRAGTAWATRSIDATPYGEAADGFTRSRASAWNRVILALTDFVRPIIASAWRRACFALSMSP